MRAARQLLKGGCEVSLTRGVVEPSEASINRPSREHVLKSLQHAIAEWGCVKTPTERSGGMCSALGRSLKRHEERKQVGSD